MGAVELIERLSGPAAKVSLGIQSFHPDDALFLLAPFTWLGWLAPILVASSVCTPILAIIAAVRYISLKRGLLKERTATQ
jgi:archaetidylinositol phosphate synthase